MNNSIYIPKKHLRLISLLTLTLGIFAYHQALHADTANGFDISNSSIPTNEILHGGPPRDGIPAISNPKHVSADQASFLRDSDRVIGIEINGEARAYSIGILNWHEIVNDRIGNQSVAITYCPLCGTGVAFDATIDGEVTEFGVSGLLYNSDVLLYDRNSESLWSQIKRQALAGDRVGHGTCNPGWRASGRGTRGVCRRNVRLAPVHPLRRAALVRPSRVRTMKAPLSPL